MEFFYYLCGLAAFVLFILFMDEKRKKKEIEEQLEQLKTTIQSLKSKHESEFDEYEKKRINRDIMISLGYTSDRFVEAVVKHSFDKLLSAKSLFEMKKEIEKAIDDYEFEKLIEKEYYPVLNKEYLSTYIFYLEENKLAIRLHKNLTPRDVIKQIDFHCANGSNINELELLSCVKSLNLRLDPYNDFAFFTDNETKAIAMLIAERFEICISKTKMENVIDPSDHSSYRRSNFGISQIFARVLFNSDELHNQLSSFNEEAFMYAVDKYFFCVVCYDINNYKAHLSELINYVKGNKAAL